MTTMKASGLERDVELLFETGAGFREADEVPDLVLRAVGQGHRGRDIPLLLHRKRLGLAGLHRRLEPVDFGRVLDRRGGTVRQAGQRVVIGEILLHDLLLQAERQKFMAEQWPRVYATIQRLGLTPKELLDAAATGRSSNAEEEAP